MYILNFTDSDASDIEFVGHSYGWSDALCGMGYAMEGEHNVPEHEAWQLVEAFEEDMDGGHNAFPMLDGRSDLARKLAVFWEEIV